MAGVKGRSGRQKSERASYKDLLSLFYGKVDLPALQKKINSGKYSPRDYFTYELATGVGKESRQTVFKKIYPDSVVQDINLKSGEFDGIRLDSPITRDKK